MDLANRLILSSFAGVSTRDGRLALQTRSRTSSLLAYTSSLQVCRAACEITGSLEDTVPVGKLRLHGKVASYRSIRRCKPGTWRGDHGKAQAARVVESFFTTWLSGLTTADRAVAALSLIACLETERGSVEAGAVIQAPQCYLRQVFLQVDFWLARDTRRGQSGLGSQLLAPV